MGLTDFICRRLICPLWARRENPLAARFATELRRRQFDSPTVIAARQLTALQRVLRHASTTVPYYRDQVAKRGLCVENVQSFKDFATWPILTKSDIRTKSKQLLSDAYRNQPLVRKTTSGSTGVPLEVRLDALGLAWKRACTLRSDEWSGWSRGERVAKVWGNPEYKRDGLKGRIRNRLYERAIYLDTLKIDETRVDQFARRLQRERPELIFGHAHSVFLLADFIYRKGMKTYRPKGIITTAMVLHDWQRKRIESVFSCPVTNRYGCEEVSLIACECEAHRGLHVNADSVLVEIVRDRKTASSGTSGAIVVTDLSNFAMPLIRYQVGDVGILTDRRCPCGRGLPILESIEGREADYVVTATGRMISGISLTENFAMLVPGVAQIQIIQDAVDRFRFRIVPDPSFGESSRRRIAGLVAERFGDNARFQFELVESIPQEPSGKYRFCISHVVGQRPEGRAA